MQGGRGGRDGWEMRGLRRGGLRRGALAVEFEHARAFAGWGAFPFTPLLVGGCLPIALKVIQHREPRYFFLGS